MTISDFPQRPFRQMFPRVLASMTLCCWLSACGAIGPDRLTRDQLDYSRALGDVEKHEMLLNIVRIRYADPPTFLDTTQVIAGYQLNRSVSAGFNAYPSGIGSYLFGSGTATLQESPTFTYQPETGQQYAENVIRPIAPVVIIPLSLGGLPIDSLLRLTAQSIDGLSNVRALGAGPSGGGSLKFYLLLHDLRQLQVAGAMTIRITPDQLKAPDAPNGNSAPPPKSTAPQTEHAYLVLTATSDPGLTSIQSEVRRLLHLDPHAEEAEFVYGPVPKVPGQIAILTRSMFAILSQIAYETEVPNDDVTSGRTLPTISPVGIETRPDVVIHSGKDLPDDVYDAVRYREQWFWINDSDFRSKLSFTMIQILAALAATSHSPGAVITIPAG